MGVVESNQPRSIWPVQRERIAQAMWPFEAFRHKLDFKLDEVPLRVVVNAPVKGEQELKRMVFISTQFSYHDMI